TLRAHVFGIPQDHNDLCGVLAQAIQSRATYICIDPTAGLSLALTQRFDTRLDLWLDRSSLVRRVYQTPWDRIYRVVAPPGAFLAAYRSWAAGDDRRALQECPDLPCAQADLASTLLAAPTTRAQGEAMLLDLVRHYPVDTASVLRLSEAWRQDGRVQDAVTLLSEAARVAQQEGRDTDAARLVTASR
ncbi:MAG TPA: hypothetical protein VGO93_05850, partial [Candidatus Xenobia bacterium]